jgi:hypothetical protein
LIKHYLCFGTKIIIKQSLPHERVDSFRVVAWRGSAEARLPRKDLAAGAVAHVHPEVIGHILECSLVHPVVLLGRPSHVGRSEELLLQLVVLTLVESIVVENSLVLLTLAVLGLAVSVVASHRVIVLLIRIVLLVRIVWLVRIVRLVLAVLLVLLVLGLSSEAGAGWLLIEVLFGFVAASGGLSCEGRLLSLVHHRLMPEAAP